MQGTNGVPVDKESQRKISYWLDQGVTEAGGAGMIAEKVLGGTQGLAVTRNGQLIVASPTNVIRRKLKDMRGGGVSAPGGALKIGDVVIEVGGYASDALQRLLQTVNVHMPAARPDAVGVGVHRDNGGAVGVKDDEFHDGEHAREVARARALSTQTVDRYDCVCMYVCMCVCI
jgi:hypothetical protein